MVSSARPLLNTLDGPGGGHNFSEFACWIYIVHKCQTNEKESSLVFDFCVACEPWATHRDHYWPVLSLTSQRHTVCFQLITYEGMHQFDFFVKISNLAI